MEIFKHAQRMKKLYSNCTATSIYPSSRFSNKHCHIYRIARHLFIHLSIHKSILFMKQIITIYNTLEITNKNIESLLVNF